MRNKVKQHFTVASAAVAVALVAPVAAFAQDAPLARAQLVADRAGEAKLTLTASAPGTDWGTAGKESAVLVVAVDGKPVTHAVTFQGATPVDYAFGLGRVEAGTHEVTVTLDTAKSPGTVAEVTNLKPSLAADDDLAARFAPILYGRDLPTVPGAFENANTDVPMLSYHVASADAQGNRVIEYTTIFSNEDGGTNTPSLMARWGRTTDIEWVYRVTVDAAGNRVSDFFQGLNHVTTAFDGLREGDHPLLQTGSDNNNFVAVKNLATASGYRFFLDTSETLPAGRAREAVMDAHPWSYLVMAKEMVRENKVETIPDPATQAMSDQRNYLWVEVKKSTRYATPPRSGNWAGTALAAKVGDRWYSSHKGVSGISIERDDPAASTIELPAGTTARDISALKVIAVPNGTPGDYTIDVTSLNRGFLLDTGYLPTRSFINWTGKLTLTPAQPEAILWENRNVVGGDVGGTVPATLALTLGTPATFGAFVPGVEKTYTAGTTAEVTSTAADATLAVSGPARLTNGAFSLPEPVQVTFNKSSWSGPATKDPVDIAFTQHIGSGDALRTGSYAATLTFTLSTQTP